MSFNDVIKETAIESAGAFLIGTAIEAFLPDRAFSQETIIPYSLETVAAITGIGFAGASFIEYFSAGNRFDFLKLMPFFFVLSNSTPRLNSRISTLSTFLAHKIKPNSLMPVGHGAVESTSGPIASSSGIRPPTINNHGPAAAINGDASFFM